MARESTIGSKFYLETLPAAATAPITAVTKGTATVITATGTYAKGDIVRIAGTTYDTLNRAAGHRVTVTGSGTFTIDTDTSGEAGAAPTSGTVQKAAYQEVMFSEFGLDNPAPNEVDVTTMRDLERNNVPGLANTGSVSFGGPLDLSDAGVTLLIKANSDKLARSLKWITRAGQTGLIYGAVSSFTGGPQGVEQAVTYTGTFQVQGSAVYLPILP